jgi:hypothetical protein
MNNAFFAGPGTHGAFLHGVALLPGTSILAGETVTTGSDGVAVLTPTHGSGGVVAMTANSTATVATGRAGRVDHLAMHDGTALVTGQVEVSTPQQQVFQPHGADTRYVVDATPVQSRMGVLAGAVTTYNPTSATSVIPAGDAIQVASTGGATQMQRVPFSQVRPPTTPAAAPQQIPASQSQ